MELFDNFISVKNELSWILVISIELVVDMINADTCKSASYEHIVSVLV